MMVLVVDRSHGERPIDELPSALDRRDEIEQTIGERTPAVFLDFDGTLAPIVLDPARSALAPPARAALERASRTFPVAVISGRDLGDLRRRVGMEGLHYAGSHGFELAGPGFATELEGARALLPALDRAERALSRGIAAIPGARLERKRFAIAVHYRGAGEGAEARARRAVEELGAARDGLRVTAGRKVVELRPDLPWDKGRAVGWMLERMGCEVNTTCPIYVGDDVTDEDGFRAVESVGVSIAVRGRKGTTRAGYRLDDPDEVARWLVALCDR
jgi:trehalose-phosphatase